MMKSNQCKLRLTSLGSKLVGRQLGAKRNFHASTTMAANLYQQAIKLFLLMLVLMIISQHVVRCHIKRTQYHEQGLHGPKSYKFGYTTGDHKNPQERHEVSDGHGHVKGWYSFLDAAGTYQVVHYEAHPKYGFKVFNHKAKAYNNGKRHYGS